MRMKTDKTPKSSGWLARVSRALIFTMLCILSLSTQKADAAVAPLDAWPATPQLTATTGNLSGTFTISAGTNRLLVVTALLVDTAATGHTYAATYGGRPLTLVALQNTNFRSTWIGYLTEADIAARVGDTLTVTITGAHTGARAFIASYTGVDQTTPATGTSFYVNNLATGALGSLTAGANGAGYRAYVWAGSVAVTRTGDTETFTEHSDLQTQGTILNLGMASKAIPASSASNPTVTWSAASRNSTASIMINSAAAGDTTPPTVSTVAVQTGLTVDVTFSEAMGAGVTTAANYTVSGTGKGSLANNPNSVALVSGNTYRLTWSAGEMLNGGNVTVTVANAQDVAGNTIGAPTSGTHTGGGIGVAPTVTINQEGAQADPTGTSPINFTVVFSESTVNFATGDVTITGTAGGTKTATVTGSGTTYNVAVTGMTTAGTVIANIAAGAATDAAGNGNTVSTSSDNTVTWSVDTTPPTVTINQAGGQADPTSTAPINFAVVFSESTVNFATGDVTITGTAGGTKTATVTGSGTTYNVAVTGMTTAGTVIANIAAGAATDAAGNGNTVSTSTDNTVSWTVAAADSLTVTGNTTIASGSRNDTATYVIMQRFQVSSSALGNGVELSSLTLDDNGASATAYSAARVYISLSSVATSTLPAGAAQIGKSTTYTGASQAIPLNLGSTADRTVTSTAPKYIYIVYDMASGQSGRTAISRVSALTAAAPDTVNAFTAIATTPAVSLTALGAGGTLNLCIGCHGDNAAFTDGTSRNNPAGTFPGSHNTHAGGSPLSLTCNNCHVNPAANNHRNGLINMVNPIYSGTGSYTKSGATYSFAQSNVPNPSMGTCGTVYCHSNVQSSTGGAMVAGDYKTPMWGGTALGCTGCHGNAPASGSHAVTQHSAAVCTTCHADPATATHVNGQINLVTVGYNGDTTPGNSNFGACTTASCHQDGTAITSYVTSSNWGVNVVANCTTCHAASPTTGSHAGHIAATNNCSTCHGAAAIKDTSYNDAAHIDNTVDVAIGSYTPNKAYGSPKTTCENTNCHGAASPTWGVNNPTYATCVKCHGVKTSLIADYNADTKRAAPGYTAASAPVGPGVDTGNSSVNTDAEVGAHDTHLRGTSGISNTIACTECHANVITTDTNFTGHMDGAGTIAWGTLATTSIGYTPSYSAPNCSNVYCHRVNRPTGAGAGQGGLTTATSWTNPALLGGTNITDTCTNKCHAMPPGAGVSGDTHAGLATVGGTLTATVLQTCSTNGGTGCHPNINSGSTTTVGALFFNRAQHIDGIVDANGHNFPYSGSLHLADAGTTPWSSCSSCHNTTAAGTYPVAVGTAPNCEACHVNGLLAPSGTSSCWDCHGASATNAQPNGAAFPNTAGSHAGHTDAAKIALACSNCHNGLGAGTAAHGNSNRVAKTEATVAFNGLLATPTYAQAANTCTLACHIAATWGAQLTCVGCHAQAVTTSAHTRALNAAVTSRASVTAEFGLAWGHKKTGRGAVTDADCIVCHLEGNFTTQQASSKHADGYIDLRDPDGVGEVAITNNSGAAFTFTKYAISYAASARTTILSNGIPEVITVKFCMKCHDANGATNTTARTTYGTPTAAMPFGGVALGATYTATNGAIGTQGLINVATQFLSTNSSRHPVGAPNSRAYPASTRLQAPYNGVGTARNANTAAANTAAPRVKADSVILVCDDCHTVTTAMTAVPTLVDRTITAHGNAVGLRGTINVASPTLCTGCHQVAGPTTANGYLTSSQHGAGSAMTTGNSNIGTNTRTCHNCHQSSNTAPARPIPAADIHGFNGLLATGGAWTYGNANGMRPIAFMRNVGRWTTTSPRPYVATVAGPGQFNLAAGASNCGGSASLGTGCSSQNHNAYSPGGSY